MRDDGVIYSLGFGTINGIGRYDAPAVHDGASEERSSLVDVVASVERHLIKN